MTGNGIVGEISGYGEANEQTVTFKGTKGISEGGVQTPDTVDETPGTTYDLHASINGTKYTTILDHWSFGITFAEGNPDSGRNTIGAGERSPAAGAAGAGPGRYGRAGRLARPSQRPNARDNLTTQARACRTAESHGPAVPPAPNKEDSG